MTFNIVLSKGYIPNTALRTGGIWDMTTDSPIAFLTSIRQAGNGAIVTAEFHSTAKAREISLTIIERHKRGLKSYVKPVTDSGVIIGFVFANYGASKDLCVIAPFNTAPNKQIPHVRYSWTC